MNPFGNSTQGGEFYEAADPFLFLGDQERDNLCNSPYIDETVGQEFAAAIAHDEELPLAFVPSFPAPVSGSGYHMPSDYRSNHFDPGHFVSTSPAVAQDNTSGPAHSLSITISSTDKDMAINGWRSDVYQSANISSPDIRFSPPESDFPPNSTFSPSSPHTDPDYFLSPTSSTASSSLAVGMQNMHLADEGSGAPITNCSLGGQRLLQSVSLRVDTEPNKDSSNLAGISAWTHGVYPDPSPSSSRRPTLGHRHSISVPSSQYLAPPTQIIRGRHGRSLSQSSPRPGSNSSSRRSSPYPSPHSSPRLTPTGDDANDALTTPSIYSLNSHSAESLTSSASSVPPPTDVRKPQVTSQAIKEASEMRRTNEARFLCEVPGCGQSFTRRSNLQGHYTAHSGEKPFACQRDGCDKSFARVSDLRRHEKKVHNLHSDTSVSRPC